MGGYSNENPFEGMTQEEIEKQWNEIVEKHNISRGGKTAAQNEFLKQLRELDYSIRRKLIYNGQMAPFGSLYIVVTVIKKTPVRGSTFKTKRSTYFAHKLIPGKQSVEFEFNVAKELRQLIKDKYSV